MIEIKKVIDLRLAQKICSDCGISWQEDQHVIATLDRDDVMNYAVFTYDGDVGAIRAIGGFENDIEMLDGLCRAILNIMDLNGVKYVYLSQKYDRLAKKVGFYEEDGQFVLQLEGFFCCKCHDKH